MMFTCRACARRALGSLCSLGSPETQPFFRTTTAHARQQKKFATATLAARYAQPATEAAKPTAGKPENGAASAKKLEWAVKKHLEHLKDPYTIAAHVLQTLDRGNYDEALLLTQKASKDQKVTVSWNHLIEYQLKSKKLHAAIKLYNDMKKRGQLSNAQTYTIIFRGLAASEHPKLAASEAFKIYQNMIRLDRIKPNTIHMNAVLQVCAFSRDIELLFTVVDTANSAHFRAPDSRTYTIIFNALWREIEPLPQRRGATEEQQKKNCETTVMRAKSLWSEVLRSWMQHKIVMDESLACAMGRILLMGNDEDQKSIVALLEQTMQLPRLESDKSDSATDTSAVPPVEESKPAPPAPIDNSKAQPIGYAIPTQQTLSLIMAALHHTHQKPLASRYWRLLTEKYGIVPDLENYTRYLKVLQSAKASTKAADLVASMPAQFLSASKIYRMSLHTCIRDNINKHAFQNACRIFDTMVKNIRNPDALAMRMFLQVARGNYRPFEGLRETDPEASKLALCRQIIAAVDRIWEPFTALCNSIMYPSVPSASPEEAWQRTLNNRVEAVAVARKIMAAIDYIVSEKGADPNTIKILKTRNTMVRQHVSRFQVRNNKMQRTIEGKRRPSS